MIVKAYRTQELEVLDDLIHTVKELQARVGGTVNRLRNAVVSMKQIFFPKSVDEADRQLKMRRKKEQAKKRRYRQKANCRKGVNRISMILVQADILESKSDFPMFTINSLDRLDHTLLTKKDQKWLQYMLDQKYFSPKLQVCPSLEMKYTVLSSLI